MYSCRYVILLLLLLAAAIIAGHGKSLWDGWFLDDHWHRQQYMDDQWSLQAMLDATTIKPDRFMHAWWQAKPIQWQYIRPVSVYIAKVVYHLSDGNVKALHGLSVILHFINAMLVHHVCLRLTRRRFWSLVGALLFVVYSHSVYAVAWLAAQNTLLMTTFLLGALICYVRASGLSLYAAPSGDPDVAGGTEPPSRVAEPEEPVKGMRCWWFAAAMLLWALALGSRENAIVFPLLAAAFDLAFGGKRHLKARISGLILMIVAAGAFAVWRLVLRFEPMPDFYVRRPDGSAYFAWWLVKLMHYVTATVWLSPMTVGPTGRFNPVTEVPGDCLLMLAILLVLGTGYYQACRRARGWWIWPLWILLSLLPVVPIMATPHSGYLPGVAFAVAMVLGAALRDRLSPIGIGRWCRPVAIWFLVATTVYMPIYRSMWQSVLTAERWTVQNIVASTRPHEAADLFFINLPFVNIYAKHHLQPIWAGASDGLPPTTMPDLRCHVLTYADNVLRMEERTRLEQIDAHSFTLSCAGRGYFSGGLGRFLLEGMASGRQFRPGEVVRGDLFDVFVARADSRGIQELRFKFHEPLASGRYLFYITTAERAGTRLRFWGSGGPPGVSALQVSGATDALIEAAAAELRDGKPEAAERLFGAMMTGEREAQLKAWLALREVALPVASGLAAPVQGLLANEDLPPKLDLARIRDWWVRSVDDLVMVQLWLGRSDNRRMQWDRDRLYRIREIAAGIIRTDLYLTGPPYPGPR